MYKEIRIQMHELETLHTSPIDVAARQGFPVDGCGRNKYVNWKFVKSYDTWTDNETQEFVIQWEEYDG